MAARLFSADDLSPGASRARARQLGLADDAYQACVASPATRAAIELEATAIAAEGFEGLPTVWIGDTRLLGFDPDQGERPYVEALERAAVAEPAPRSGMPWLILGAVVVVLWFAPLARSRPRSAQSR